MPIRLKCHGIAPPDYFQFMALGKVWRNPTMPDAIREVLRISAEHPELNLPRDKFSALEWLDEINALRVAELDGGFVDLTVQSPPLELLTHSPCYMAGGGRFGDLMIILPGLKHQFESTGIKPVVICAKKFSGLFDGVSYADCWPVYGLNHVDNSHLMICYSIAKRYFGDGQIVVPKWWEIGTSEPKFHKEPDDSWRSKVTPDEMDTYMTNQWRACGWTMTELLEWPLVFDKRDSVRESVLVSENTTNRPFVLFNFSGISSPFSEGSKILEALAPLTKEIDLIDLSAIKAERIYDLLGLFDLALCLVTIDTSTFHLSAASTVPTIHLQRSGHGGSLPRGNSILKVKYDHVDIQLKNIKDAIENQLHHHRERQRDLSSVSDANNWVI